MNASQEHLEIPRVALASWNFQEVSTFLCLSLFVLLVLLIKYAYHKMKWVAAYIPESLILIVIGLIYTNKWRLSPDLFFNILLPPIMMESAYSIYTRKFAEILPTILLFAVIGTVLNFLFIGLGLYVVELSIGIGEPNLYFGIKEFLLFASLIVAVDPVAVLAIFQDIGVDLSLYYMVFGESLLNDAVTVVLYTIMSAFVASSTITGWQISMGIASFFTVSLGGALIGLLHGILSCLLTRFNVGAESLGILLLSYLAYIVANLFSWSGIISIIVCGVFQSAYAFHNLKPISVMLLESAVEQLSSITEAIIFLLLGSEVFALKLRWHTGFLITSLVLCIVSRFVVTVALSAVVNKNRSKKRRISWSEQIIISYGGLRGAVAFSLAVLINAEDLGMGSHMAREVLVTTAIAVIFFSVAIMGTTIKPLVRLLNIRLNAPKEAKQSLFLTLNDSVIEETLIFVEELISTKGVHSIVRALSDFDDKYIKPILQRDAATHDMRLVNAYDKLALKIHSEAIDSRASLSHREVDLPREHSPEPPELDISFLPSLILPPCLPSNKHQRRLTLAALSSMAPGATLVPGKSMDFASAQRTRFAKLHRTQATFARTMEHFVRQYESTELQMDSAKRQNSNRRGQLTRQYAKCADTDSSSTGFRRLMKPRPKLTFSHSTLARTPEDAQEEVDEALVEDGKSNTNKSID
uniref:Sodium/hydrogen exchanger n=1 Tax=Mesocestoides corti TaxID=53468 RepID=A0A5K3FAX5_MESCO